MSALDLNTALSRAERVRVRKERERQRYIEKKAEITKRNEAWWKAHPEQRRLKDRRRYWRNRPQRLAACKAYRVKNADSIKAKKRAWQKRTWSQRQQYFRKYYLQKRDMLRARSKLRFETKKPEILAKQRIYNQGRLEQRRAYLAIYNVRNKEKLRKCAKAWRDKHRAEWTARSQHRRALTKRATVNLRQICEWMRIVKSKATIRCYWCSKTVNTKLIHFDHIIALSKGGEHRVENLCASCARCNLSKSNKTIRVWTRVGQQMLEL